MSIYIKTHSDRISQYRAMNDQDEGIRDEKKILIQVLTNALYSSIIRLMMEQSIRKETEDSSSKQ